jgi:hypothetical protein
MKLVRADSWHQMGIMLSGLREALLCAIGTEEVDPPPTSEF